MHNNTYNVVGTSVLNGVLKVRFANGLAKREKVLARNGHVSINLMDCAELHKLDAAKFALTQTERFSEVELALFEAYIKANSIVTA